MSEEEKRDLYQKSCDNEEDEAIASDGEESESLKLAADFSDWLATLD